MSKDRNREISEHAYRLWEKEGRPAGRDVEHWVEAERQLDGNAAPNEGEGNRTAARSYNRKAKAFAESGKVEGQARKAKADLDGPDGRELREAAVAGKSRARGEDPAVKRR